MYRATTPTHYFTLPFDYEQYVQKVLITYAQNTKPILEKTESDIQYNGKTIYYTLTQEETNLFNSESPVELQVRVLTKNGVSMASKTYLINVSTVLNDEVL